MSMAFTERMERVEPSATLAISALAKELRADGADVVDLSVGEPDFPTPEPIVKAGVEAMHAGHTGYTPSQGIPQLRDAIADKLREDGLSYDSDQLIVTPGAKQALYEAIQTLVGPGDEVILLDPAWVSYEAMVSMAGGEATHVDLTPHGFHLEPAIDALADAMSDQTEVLIVNTPSNPTGVVYSEAALEGVRDLAVKHDVTVISDEIYERIVYGERPPSMATFEGMGDRTITINGFSKSYSMTGWRLGYLAGPQAFIEQAAKLQSHSVSCATNFVQHAGITALAEGETAIQEMVNAFEARRDHVVERLDDLGVALPAVPEGAFYLMVPVVGEDQETCEQALAEAHVATVPGSAFGAPGYARMSYANSMERIDIALDRLAEIDYFRTD